MRHEYLTNEYEKKINKRRTLIVLANHDLAQEKQRYILWLSLIRIANKKIEEEEEKKGQQS